jgi:hypothetical protein
MVIVIVVIFVLLFIEGVLMAFVFVSPSAGEKLGDVKADIIRAWSGAEGQPGVRAKVASAFHRGYQDWIVPLWAEPRTPTGDPEFTACVDCHRDYATKRRFDVYMNHPLHAQLGIQCTTCHPQNAHPNPPHPLEKVCATCHEQVEQKDACGFCHPPASLPHFYLLGAPRGAIVECNVCHPKKTFDTGANVPLVHVGTFDGVDRGACLSCHEDATCAQCHAPGHPSDWVATHGQIVGQGGAVNCYACHSSTWCSDRCHAVTDTSPLVPRPLPPGKVRP